jgi:hypothetical protein
MRVATRKSSQRFGIAAYKRFFFLTPPTFQLPFDNDRICQVLKILRPHKNNGSTARCVSTKPSGIVLKQTSLKPGAGDADIVGAVCAAKDVNVNIHMAPLSFDKFRMRVS